MLIQSTEISYSEWETHTQNQNVPQGFTNTLSRELSLSYTKTTSATSQQTPVLSDSNKAFDRQKLIDYTGLMQRISEAPDGVSMFNMLTEARQELIRQVHTATGGALQQMGEMVRACTQFSLSKQQEVSGIQNPFNQAMHRVTSQFASTTIHSFELNIQLIEITQNSYEQPNGGRVITLPTEAGYEEIAREQSVEAWVMLLEKLEYNHGLIQSITEGDRESSANKNSLGKMIQAMKSHLIEERESHTI